MSVVARQHGVRLVVRPTGTNALDTRKLSNRSWINKWIANVTAEVAALRSEGVSGLNLDVEKFENTSADTKQLFTRAICELHHSRLARNLSLHSLDTAIRGFTEFFDLPGLAKCVEFLLPMAYDMVEKDG